MRRLVDSVGSGETPGALSEEGVGRVQAEAALTAGVMALSKLSNMGLTVQAKHVDAFVRSMSADLAYTTTTAKWRQLFSTEVT